MILTVVIPCRDEKRAIPLVMERLEQLRTALKQRFGTGAQLEIVVVDDGSRDGSAEELAKLPQITVQKNAESRGYGYALKQGFALAKGDFVGFLDMDNTYDAIEFIPMLERLINSDIKMVCGARMGEHTKMPITRLVGNKLFVCTIQILFGKKVQDACTGMRVFSSDMKELFLRINQDQLDFSLLQTLYFLKHKIKFVEMPIRYGERVGESKLSLGVDGLRFLLSILRVRFAEVF